MLVEINIPKAIAKSLKTTQFGINPVIVASNEAWNLLEEIQNAINTGELNLGPITGYVHPNHTGDVTSVGDGVTTINPNTVTNQKLADMPANTVKVRATNTPGDPQDLVIANNQLFGRGSSGNLTPITLGTNLSMSGNTLNSTAGAGGYATIQEEGTSLPTRSTVDFQGAGVVATDSPSKTIITIPGVVDGSVTNVKLDTMPGNTIKGNNTNTTAQPVDLTVSQVKTMLDYQASEIDNTPAGNIAATNIQSAINELDTEKQKNLQFKFNGTNLGTAGSTVNVDFVGSVAATESGGTVTVNCLGGGGGGANLQFQDQGNNLGIAGTVDTLNFLGRNITAVRTGNTVELTDSGEGVQLAGVDVATQPIINFIPGDNAFIQATNDNANSRVNVTIHSETYTQVYRNNGVTIKATKPGVTFTRTTASVWTINVPLNCELRSLDIFSTAAQNPGANLTLNINTLSTVYNQTGDFSTIHVPFITGLNLNGTTGSLPGNYAPTTGSTNLQPFVDSFGNGDIQIRIQNFNNASGLGTGATLLKLVF